MNSQKYTLDYWREKTESKGRLLEIPNTAIPIFTDLVIAIYLPSKQVRL